MDEDEYGDVLLTGGSRDGDVVRHVALEETISIPVGASVERYRRTGSYEQLRGVEMAEPFRRFWIYEHLGSE